PQLAEAVVDSSQEIPIFGEQVGLRHLKHVLGRRQLQSNDLVHVVTHGRCLVDGAYPAAHIRRRQAYARRWYRLTGHASATLQASLGPRPHGCVRRVGRGTSDGWPTWTHEER